MKFRIVFEIETEGTAEAVGQWGEQVIAMLKRPFKDGSGQPFHPYRPRVVAVTKVVQAEDHG